MPIFIYSNPITGEIREIVQSVHDDHSFVDESGLKWVREWTNPTYSISSISNIDPNNIRQFLDVTGSKKGNLGNIQDLNEELSQKREKLMGQDPIKIATNERYKKHHNGKELPEFRKKKLKENLKKTMFEWSDL